LADSAETFEEKLNTAMAIDAPQDLAKRILAQQSSQRKAMSSRRRQAFALAAGLILSLTVIVGLYITGYSKGLEQAVIAQVNAEPHALTLTREVQAPALEQTLKALGAELTASLGKVTFAHDCKIRKRTAAHLVVAEAETPVTVLLMPGQQVTRRSQFSHGKLNGTIVPISGGSMAIMAEQPDLIDPMEERLRSAVRWRL
jgi:hypothetical protein